MAQNQDVRSIVFFVCPLDWAISSNSREKKVVFLC